MFRSTESAPVVNFGGANHNRLLFTAGSAGFLPPSRGGEGDQGRRGGEAVK